MVGEEDGWVQRSAGEILMKRYLDEFFGGEKHFDNIRPEWLRKGGKGFPLELDRYYPGLRLAFEYQGAQHYDPEVRGMRKFYRLWERDDLKRRICQGRGIRVVYVDASKLNWRWLGKRIREVFKKMGLGPGRFVDRKNRPLRGDMEKVRDLNRRSAAYRRRLKKRYGMVVTLKSNPGGFGSRAYGREKRRRKSRRRATMSAGQG